jgi:hypothetical protein
MAADSDSRIAWHRAQVRKHRDALKRVEMSKFMMGTSANPKALARDNKLAAELAQKIRLSEQVIAEHERQSRRPLATDLQSLANVTWGHWNAHGGGQR